MDMAGMATEQDERGLCSETNADSVLGIVSSLR